MMTIMVSINLSYERHISPFIFTPKDIVLGAEFDKYETTSGETYVLSCKFKTRN
jgi:hypothetical protein